MAQENNPAFKTSLAFKPASLQDPKKRILALLLAAITITAVSCSTADPLTSNRSAQSTTTSTDSPLNTDKKTPGSDSTSQPTVMGEADESSWDGEEIELFAQKDDTLHVVGTAADDVLNVRSGPGVEHPIVTTLEPTGSTKATGRAWQAPSTFWYEIKVGDQTGWASIRFLAYLGPVDDATGEVNVGPAETLIQLGTNVANSFASTDPPSAITVTDTPQVDSGAEVTVDILDIGDDAVSGFRLRIVALEDGNGETFSVDQVERTTLCTRGLAEGVCR